MNPYRVLVSARLNDDPSLLEALAAHQRRRPRDQRVQGFIPSRWRVVAIRSRNYAVQAPRPWWTWVTGWRP